MLARVLFCFLFVSTDAHGMPMNLLLPSTPLPPATTLLRIDDAKLIFFSRRVVVEVAPLRAQVGLLRHCLQASTLPNNTNIIKLGC